MVRVFHSHRAMSNGPRTSTRILRGPSTGHLVLSQGPRVDTPWASRFVTVSRINLFYELYYTHITSLPSTRPCTETIFTGGPGKNLRHESPATCIRSSDKEHQQAEVNCSQLKNVTPATRHRNNDTCSHTIHFTCHVTLVRRKFFRGIMNIIKIYISYFISSVGKSFF